VSSASRISSVTFRSIGLRSLSRSSAVGSVFLTAGSAATDHGANASTVKSAASTNARIMGTPGEGNTGDCGG